MKIIECKLIFLRISCSSGLVIASQLELLTIAVGEENVSLSGGETLELLSCHHVSSKSQL